MGLSSSPSDREAIVLVRYFVRLKIADPSRLDQSGRLWAASEPISCAARRHIRAIEHCVSRLFSVARSTISDDFGSTCRQIESDQSPRYNAATARVLCYRVRPTIR